MELTYHNGIPDNILWQSHNPICRNANMLQTRALQKLALLGFETHIEQERMANSVRWFDKEGAWAASAAFDPTLLNQFLSDPYFQLKPPKSTGPEYFNLNWIRSHFTSLAQPLTPAIVQATLCELVARHVAHAIQRLKSKAGVILLCGGGSKNTFLKKRLQHHCYPHRLYLTDEKGISSDWLEAMAFAWIAKQTLEGKISNLPEVTGAQKGVILGGIYLKN